jgi:radical SAM protein with 4Fe4S-binding SPASM domain
MSQFSLILLSTLQCNADCKYCFENKTSDRLSHAQLKVIVHKVLDYLEVRGLDTLTIYWQGGEAMLLPPSWYEKAYQLVQKAAETRNKQVHHSLQSNLLAYGPKWNPVIAAMFGNQVGTSMDYPNLHRQVLGGSAEAYTALWERKVRAVREAGIQVQVIAVPNQGTLALGAERFYTYFVDELKITDFQINTPFPGGELNAMKKKLSLDREQLIRFHLDLADLWIEHGYPQGVTIGPFAELLNYFSHRSACLPCIWGENCIKEFLAVDARGYIAQCDCWVTSYPQYRFGNLFTGENLADLLQNSASRRYFQERPLRLVQGDCIECDYLSLCHGGCPVRTYAVRGTLFDKDPYCAFYKSLFGHMEKMATRIARKAAVAHEIEPCF